MVAVRWARTPMSLGVLEVMVEPHDRCALLVGLAMMFWVGRTSCNWILAGIPT